MTLSQHFRRFLVEYLPDERRASPHTVEAYSDSLRLFTVFLRRKTGRGEEDLQLADVSAETVVEFLDNLENERRYRACSRNVRLTAIRSFCRMLAAEGLCGPECGVFEIAGKRAEPRRARRLTEREMEAILAAPDRNEWSGRRDHALLLLMYNTGARVPELAGMRREQVRLEGACAVSLRDWRAGERIVPLWRRTIRTLQKWFEELERAGVDLAFPSARGGRLSDDGVGYLVQHAVERAIPSCPTLADRRVTPGAIRHTAALYFLRAGIEPEVVARWLGRRSVEAIRLYRREIGRGGQRWARAG